MEKITTVELPKSSIHQYLIISDVHSDHYCENTWNTLLRHLKLLKRSKRRVIIAGDFLDCVHLMGKKTDLKKIAASNPILESVIIPESEKEFQWGNDRLDELQELTDHIYFLEGNHDWRYRNFADNYAPAAYVHNFDLSIQLRLKEREIVFIGYNDWLDIGNLSITHGMFHGTTHNKKHYEACRKNVIYGHVHHHNCTSFFSRGDAKKAWSLPCACKLNPDYRKNTDSNWTNGYASIMMKPNGNFNLHIHEIFDNELYLPNGIKV